MQPKRYTVPESQKECSEDESQQPHDGGAQHKGGGRDTQPGKGLPLPQHLTHSFY